MSVIGRTEGFPRKVFCVQEIHTVILMHFCFGPGFCRQHVRPAQAVPVIIAVEMIILKPLGRGINIILVEDDVPGIQDRVDLRLA